MNFLRKLFSSKEEEVNTIEDFWNWFMANENHFYRILVSQNNIQDAFVIPVANKLEALQPGCFLLAGMKSEETAELILTSDGNVTLFYFIDELVAAAPQLSKWKFTAGKPSRSMEDVGIRMGDLAFHHPKLSFYAEVDDDYPDWISLCVIHEDATAENIDAIAQGVHIYLDLLLGEEHYATLIDEVKALLPEEAEADLVAMEKLKDFLLWREKEFVEKYTGVGRSSEDDTYAVLESKRASGSRSVGTFNNMLLQCENPVAYPWILAIAITYDTSRADGLPDDEGSDKLQALEDAFFRQLKGSDGYLYLGKESSDGVQDVFFACCEYRKSSRIVADIIAGYDGAFELDYNIYKDKYWRTFEEYRQALMP